MRDAQRVGLAERGLIIGVLALCLAIESTIRAVFGDIVAIALAALFLWFAAGYFRAWWHERKPQAPVEIMIQLDATTLLRDLHRAREAFGIAERQARRLHRHTRSRL